MDGVVGLKDELLLINGCRRLQEIGGYLFQDKVLANTISTARWFTQDCLLFTSVYFSCDKDRQGQQKSEAASIGHV